MSDTEQRPSSNFDDDNRRGRSRSRSNNSGREGGDRREGGKPQSLLVRNLNYQTDAYAVREAFKKYSEGIRDVYLPKDFKTGRPRGFAFLEFLDKEEALDAMNALDGTEIDGRQVTIILAQERRKTGDQMRGRRGGGGGYDRRRRDYSRSPSPYRSRRRRRSYSRSASRSPPRRRHNRSRSPHSPRRNNRHHHRRSPSKSYSPVRRGGRDRSASPANSRGQSRD